MKPHFTFSAKLRFYFPHLYNKLLLHIIFNLVIEMQNTYTLYRNKLVCVGSAGFKKDIYPQHAKNFVGKKSAIHCCVIMLLVYPSILSSLIVLGIVRNIN